MNLATARREWEKNHEGESWEALSHDEQMEILTRAVQRERAKRKAR